MNNNNRLIKTQTTDVFTAGLRPEYVDIPPFYMDGVATLSLSGPWSPSRNVLLTDWYAQSGDTFSAGVDTVFGLLVGDNIFNTSEVSRYITIEANTNKASADIETNYIDKLIITPLNWIKVLCLEAGDHSDITVQIYGRAV
jgi:hypothetical protein